MFWQNVISDTTELDVLKNAAPSTKRHVTGIMLLFIASMAVKVVGKELIVKRVSHFLRTAMINQLYSAHGTVCSCFISGLFREQNKA